MVCVVGCITRGCVPGGLSARLVTPALSSTPEEGVGTAAPGERASPV